MVLHNWPDLHKSQIYSDNMSQLIFPQHPLAFTSGIYSRCILEITQTMSIQWVN